MDKGFQNIIKQYTESHREFGDTPSAILTPKGRNDLRYIPIKAFDGSGYDTILDYGCGIGLLYNFLNTHEINLDYTGYDITPSFVEACKSKYCEGKFELIEPDQKLNGAFDIVFASGVFNISSSESEIVSKSYALNRIERLFEISNDILICDFLSDNVDFKQEGAQHFSVAEIASFCQQRLSRKFHVRHDILPYEFTLVAFKDERIARPDNVFEA